ncbi:glycogen-binding subunit 76A-like [Ornithodoros turicata]|uniref:glycogen-binding subunit 76A-like n=1 Tax=Ornithodoros turicata TaxID=34597 RepID=UPI00313876A6
MCTATVRLKPGSRDAESCPHDNVLNNIASDRMYLYLPRNLSYCHMCTHAQEQHVQYKMRLLRDFLKCCATDDVLSKDLERKKTPEGPTPGASILHCRKSPDPDKQAWRQRRRTRMVKFADSLGLELEHVRFLISDGARTLRLPSLPEHGPATGRRVELTPLFEQPSADDAAFRKRLWTQKVCLHSVAVRDLSIHGVVSVLNLTYHKTVFVRYTVNGWRSHVDLEAYHVAGSTREGADQFAFVVLGESSDDARSDTYRVEFAVCYQTQDHREFWDNNVGMNYAFRVVLSSSSILKMPLHFL